MLFQVDGDIGQAVNAFKDGGVILGIGFAIRALIGILRAVGITTLIGGAGAKWVAMFLGALGGVSAGLIEGKQWYVAILDGVMAGFAAISAYELTKTKKKV